eukprot:scaffold1167_cov418-Prasinococcus_capsulatus_cf.AAC.22
MPKPLLCPTARGMRGTNAARTTAANERGAYRWGYERNLVLHVPWSMPAGVSGRGLALKGAPCSPRLVPSRASRVGAFPGGWRVNVDVKCAQLSHRWRSRLRTHSTGEMACIILAAPSPSLVTPYGNTLQPAGRLGPVEALTLLGVTGRLSSPSRWHAPAPLSTCSRPSGHRDWLALSGLLLSPCRSPLPLRSISPSTSLQAAASLLRRPRRAPAS